MAIKRWILALFAGLVLSSLAIAMGLAWIYRYYAIPERFTEFVQAITLQFIPHPYRELIMLAVGVVFVLWGFYQLSRSLLAPFRDASQSDQSLVEIIQSHRFGPDQPEMKIVTIGGGTGLSTLLRGLKTHDAEITAVVTVGDDGGSSGRLRTEFNMPPPGDIRNCIVALADSESLMSELFQHRFAQEGSALHGHSFGNIFITALTQVSGSFERAVVESSRVLAIRGTVLPSSLDNITVCAEMADGRIIKGESAIVNEHTRISKVFLEPAAPEVYEPAIEAILDADLIVLGPGSLYTSVLPNLLLNRIPEAIGQSHAAKVYVCNVATQRGETDNFGALDHIRTLLNHAGDTVIDHVLVNDNVEATQSFIQPEWHVSAVGLEGLEEFQDSIRIVRKDVVNPEFPLRHDPQQLADELIAIGRDHMISQPYLSPTVKNTETNGRFSYIGAHSSREYVRNEKDDRGLIRSSVSTSSERMLNDHEGRN